MTQKEVCESNELRCAILHGNRQESVKTFLILRHGSIENTKPEDITEAIVCVDNVERDVRRGR